LAARVKKPLGVPPEGASKGASALARSLAKPAWLRLEGAGQASLAACKAATQGPHGGRGGGASNGRTALNYRVPLTNQRYPFSNLTRTKLQPARNEPAFWKTNVTHQQTP
jgi:hypothetical protein